MRTKLELTWPGKEVRPRLEPRILVADAALSHHATERVTGQDAFDNILIQGDNLLALKALAAEGRKVKCIFIDPPYNTGSAFEHYDDGLEHSLWLTMMRDRLDLLFELLSDSGSIWITIDDNEAHYLKILCDEVFGRKCFVGNITWQKRTSRENRAALSVSHDHILVYAKAGPIGWRDIRNRLPATEAGFSNPDNDPRGPWRSVPFSAQGYRTNQMYKISTPTGLSLDPPRGRCWAATEPVFVELLADSRVYFPNNGNGRPRVKVFQGEESGLVPTTWWDAVFAGDNEAAKKEMLALQEDGAPFPTPKPEELLHRILEVATNEGDLVLDSFAGSGTTGAVAHKMRRQWIMVELGNHAITHIVPRLKKVIDGEDLGGVTQATNWKGGGGFRFYRLAPSLIGLDTHGNPIINEKYNGAMLAEAVCKLHGYLYEPDPDTYWMQGRANEAAYIYVTTQHLSHEQIASLSEAVGTERTLLVCCGSFQGKPEQFENLEVKKIPQSVLGKCEFGRDDYSVEVANLPMRNPDSELGGIFGASHAGSTPVEQTESVP